MKFPFVTRRAYEVLRKEKRQIDWLMWFTGLIGPISTLPQLWVIYIDKKVAGISLISWIMYFIVNLVGLAYAIVHKLKPVLIANILWFFVELAIIIGVIVYE
jgi:uncharacterized protein with PQ loop repeat